MCYKVIQTNGSHTKPIRVLYWGMDNDFSRQVLDGLIEQEIYPAAVIIPGFNGRRSTDSISQAKPQKLTGSLPIKNPYLNKRIYHIAWDHDIPIFTLHEFKSQNVLRILTELEPTVSFVACFPKQIPTNILNLPLQGFLNLHPSLLPSLRGPYPLFWTFRLGCQPGITLHFMDEGLDTGSIVFQKTVEFADGINGSEADRIMAQAGVCLLDDAYAQLINGSLPSYPQVGSESTYPRPAASDFFITTTWTGKRAFNFMRGTAEWNHPYLIQGPDFQFKIHTADSYTPYGKLNSQFMKNGSQIQIQFSPGILHAR